MKRLIGILSGIIYLFSGNALIHAGFMGFFNHQSEHITTHCHSTQPTDQQKENIDCCELVYSNEYFTNQIEIKNQIKNNISLIIPTFIETIRFLNNKEEQQINTNAPPGQNNDNKYNTFSDLVGIIVNTI